MLSIFHFVQEYEKAMVEASCVYLVDLASSELVPLEEGWGLPPHHTLLRPDQVTVWDFGSELYVYSGKNVTFKARRAGARLAQELHAGGWDYTGCRLNPALGKVAEMVVVKRPKWTVLGRIYDGMETVLFREKFADWPDRSRLRGTKVGPCTRQESETGAPPEAGALADLAGVGGADLAQHEQEAPGLELEGFQLGRGRSYYDEQEKQNYEIKTLGVAAWHVEESARRELGEGWSGQFHTEDMYVVRWRYKVALTGPALEGGASRERVAFFFWEGAESKTTLQGASALQTVELDSEKGPQLRVAEGREQAAFLQLWRAP